MLRRDKGPLSMRLRRRSPGSRTPCADAGGRGAEEKLGLDVTSEKDDTRGRVYRIAC